MNDATPEILTRPEQPYLAVGREITDGIRSAVDAAFPRLFGRLGEHGVTPAGPPFIRYRGWTPACAHCVLPGASGRHDDFGAWETELAYLVG